MKRKRVTSRANPVFKRVRKAATGVEYVLVEGPKLLEEALAGEFPLSEVLISDNRLDNHEELARRCSDAGARVVVMPERLLEVAGDVVTSQGIVALTQSRFDALEDVVPHVEEPLVVCDGIQDPGNIGAVVRSSLAFGASAVIFTPGCANPFGAKAVRGAAGACFRISLIRADYQELRDFLKSHRLRTFALDNSGESILWEIDFDVACAIIVGNEGAGIGEEIISEVDRIVRIPVGDAVESLNAAVAASIILYEISRRRNNGE